MRAAVAFSCPKQMDYLDLGRPAFKGGKVASTAFRPSTSIFEISATPIRSNSLFFTSTPALRQAFLTEPSTAYSGSGMEKLSRISFDFLTLGASAASALAGLAAFTGLAGLAGFAALGLAAPAGFF